MQSERLDFSRRAHLSEWMDEPCAYADFRACLKDLERANQLLRGYKPTLEWITPYLDQHSSSLQIVDVGSGGGGMLREIQRSAETRGGDVRLTGIDLNPFAARAAAEFSLPGTSIDWITADALLYRSPAPVDLIISSLFTHHLSEAHIIRFLRWMEETATRGWFINDLRRSAKSYYSFKALAAFLGWHRFVQHDGPVSIRRAFSPEDWQQLCREAGLKSGDVEIVEQPFGRLCVSRRKR